MSTPNSHIATTTGAGAGDSRPTAGPSDDPKKKRTKPKPKKQKPGNGNNNNNSNSTKFKGNVTSGALSGVVMDNPNNLVDDLKNLSNKLVLHVAVEEEQPEWLDAIRDSATKNIKLLFPLPKSDCVKEGWEKTIQSKFIGFEWRQNERQQQSSDHAGHDLSY